MREKNKEEEVGLQYASAVNAPSDHPMIVGVMRQLVSAYNAHEDYWPATFLDVNDAPHAPWWSLNEVCAPTEDNWPNPSAELAGYVYCFTDLTPPDFKVKLEKRVVQNLKQGGGMTVSMKYYNFLCWQRVFPYIPVAIQQQIMKSMHTALEHPSFLKT